MPEPELTPPPPEPPPPPAPTNDEDSSGEPSAPSGPVITPRPRPGRPRGRTTRRRVAAARRTDKPVLTPRMSFYIKDDGSIDFDRTNDATLEQLRGAITKPDAQKRLGLVDDAGTPTPPRTWTSMTAVLVDSLNAIAVQAAVNTWQLTDEQAQLLLLRSDKRVDANGKTVYQNVEQLTGELLDKYFPGGFGAYDKEVSLLILLGGFTANAVQKIQAMKAAAPPRPSSVVVDWDSAARAAAGH